MIGRIAGVILHRAMDHVLIDVRGVGYIVHVSQRTAAALPPVGEATALYTDLLVREDLLQLFGFPSPLEREWHRLLMTVQGVGAKVALATTSAAVARSPGNVIVAGHTDNIPISTARFRSNWELSSARAVTVVHGLLKNPDIDPGRVMIEGHADSRPLMPNDSSANRAINRRVELILERGNDMDNGDMLIIEDPKS